MKKLAEIFQGKFHCLAANTEKYIAFSVPIKKEVTKIDKSGEKVTKTISYTLQFVYSEIFMASSLSKTHYAKTSCKSVFKTSPRRLTKMSSRHFQDLFKTYHQVNPLSAKVSII